MIIKSCMKPVILSRLGMVVASTGLRPAAAATVRLFISCKRL